MSLQELNTRLSTPFVAGYVPTAEDAALFKNMFGDNVAVAQWAARMAAYYQAERESLVAPPKEEAKEEAKEVKEAKKQAKKGPIANVGDANDRLGETAFVGGDVPTAEDAALFKDMFGDNASTAQWASRMAAYYQVERESLLKK